MIYVFSKNFYCNNNTGYYILMNNFSISVMIPAYNEEENIKNTISECIDFLDKRFEDYEIIAVNDGSSDRMDEKLDLISKWILVWLKN